MKSKILAFLKASKILPFLKNNANLIRKNFASILCILIIIFSAFQTFNLENTVIGWEPRYEYFAPAHHGLVSSLTLAIITTATPENNFVGYAVEYKDEQNNLHYDYFDRYPVFYSALFNQVLNLRPKLSSKIYLAKQVMNVIFLTTILLAFLILSKLLKNKLIALIATLLAFANPFLLFYKDMVHFDQPALFGFLLLIYAITLYKIDGWKWPLYVSTLIAVALGRGYASLAVLVLWLVIEGILILRTHGQAFGEKVKTIIKHPAFLVLVLGIVWAASLLSYNIIIEAQKTNVPILQTSIFQSAEKRLSLNQGFNEANANIINWGQFIKTEINWIIQWAFPINKVNFGFVGNTILLLGMFTIMGIVIQRQSPERRIIYLILTLSGFAWLFPMRNLAAFHDYTTMYYIGIPLVFISSLFVLLKPSRDATYYLALMAAILYFVALVQVRDLAVSISGNTSQYTYDFMNIQSTIEGAGNNVYFADIVPDGPYAPRFYLSDQYLAPEDISDYVITSDENYGALNLTPDNEILFLFEK